MRRRHSLLVVSVVFLMLTVSMFMEVQSVSGATGTYNMTVSYKINGGGSPAAPIINYVTPDGTHLSQEIPLYTNTPLTLTMCKNTPWSVTNPLSTSTSERWYSTGSISGITKNSGSATKVFEFQHQYYLTVVSNHDTPSGNGWYNSGSTAYAQLTKGTIQSGSDTRYIFSGWNNGALGTSLKSNAIKMDAPKTATANWKTQYQITLNVNPAYAGTITPSGTHYYDSGQSIQIAANPSGNTFTAWTQTGTITIASPTSQTTTATINGPGTITANFATATQKPTHLTIQCIPGLIDQNQAAIIKGTLTDQCNHPLSGKTIVLTYSSTANSLSWTGIGHATTGSDGSYQFTWTINMPVGAYFVMAQFAGDQTYRCSSTVGSTNGTELTVVPEYAYGALVALGSCFIGLFVFKKTRQTNAS